MREQRKRDEFAASGRARFRRRASAGPRKGEMSCSVGAGAIARPRADVGIDPYTRKKGTDVPLRRKRRIRAGRPRKKMSFSDRLCLTQPVRDDILLTVFKDSRWAQAGNPAENAATTG